MSTTLHPLGERFPRLVNPDLSGELNTFYNTLGAALGEYEAAIAKAGKVDPDLIPARRAERQHRLVNEARRKLDRALNVEIQALNVSRENIRQEIDKAARPRTAETEIGQLLSYLKESELRAELRKLDSETKAKLLRESVSRGDRSILTALEGSLTPILAPILLADARESYAEAVAQEPMQRLEMVEHIAASAQETARRAGYEADKMVKGAEDILPPHPGERPPSQAAHLSDAQKAELIGKVGAAGYQAIYKGERPLPPAYWPEADKEAFATEHGGEAWEKFQAGTWTPP